MPSDQIQRIKNEHLKKNNPEIIEMNFNKNKENIMEYLDSTILSKEMMIYSAKHKKAFEQYIKNIIEEGIDKGFHFEQLKDVLFEYVDKILIQNKIKGPSQHSIINAVRSAYNMDKIKKKDFIKKT